MFDLPSADSPYAGANQRVGEWFLQSVAAKAPLLPDAVADVIAEAVAADEPKLRYLVGEDAISECPLCAG